MADHDQMQDEFLNDWDAAYRVGSKIIEAAERCRDMHKIVGGAQATWHFEMDDVRFKVTIEVGAPADQDAANQ